MAFDPLEGIQHLELHLARMKASAKALGFTFDRHDARNELQAATFRLRDARRIRLLLARSGTLVVEIGPAPAPFDGVVPVRVVPLPVSPFDLRLRHKTSARGFYDAARQAAGTAEGRKASASENPMGTIPRKAFRESGAVIIALVRHYPLHGASCGKLVSRAPDGLDQVLAVVTQRETQAADVYVHRALLDEHVITPYLIQ